jgi:flagellar hook-associated protein 3 FlgL
VVSALNTRFGDRSVFSGVETSAPALADPEVILSAIEGAVAGANSAADVASMVTAWFDAPAGFTAIAYLGGAASGPLTIAAGERVDLNITAIDPAIKETLKGLAMAALLDRGILLGLPVARQELAKTAGLHLLQSNADRAHLTGRLGAAEAQIEQASARNGAEATALRIVRNNITTVDPYEAAARLQDMQAQLEKIYTLTARMTRLTLMDYL